MATRPRVGPFLDAAALGLNEEWKTTTTKVDQIERVLADAAREAQKAWTNNRCQTCPLAEIAATMAAALTYYQEAKRMGVRE